jgi:hypothetical protein
VVITQAIAVVSLVEAGETKEVGGSIAGGNGAFGSTADSGSIIIEEGEGASTGVNGLDKDILVSNHPGKFEITDGEIAKGIFRGDKASLDRNWKRGAPKERGCTIDKPDATHARLGSINSTNTGGYIRNNLS